MKILAVCGFGVGSSMVLKMTAERVCREIGLDAEVENTDLSSAKGTYADLILTSYELAEEIKNSTKTKIYPIKKYMDKEEVRVAIEKYVNENK